MLQVNGTFIDGKCIRFVDSAKNLGVLLDRELSFKDHISKVVSSCYYVIKSISGIKAFLNESQLVWTLVFSKLDYCNGLYYGLSSELINKLQVVQNSALSLIFNMHRYDRVSTTPFFKKLHWLRVKECIVFKILLIVHKSIIGAAPADIENMVQFSKSGRTMKLAAKTSIGSYGDRAFSVVAPKLWNALPQDIRGESLTTKFKKRLKSYLLLHSDSFLIL